MLVDGVLKATLVRYLPAHINVYTMMPANPQLPYAYCKHVGGGDINEEIDSIRAVVVLRTVSESLFGANEITTLCHKAFLRAEEEGLVTPFGGIEWVNRYQYPRELRTKTQPDNETILESMYQLSMLGPLPTGSELNP